MRRRIYILGASLNPPGRHHEQIAHTVTARLDRSRGDRLVVVPCGTRPDKKTTNDIDPVHRAAMTQIAFGVVEGVEIDLSDLEEDEFTRTWDLDQRFKERYPDAEIWHVIGKDLVQEARYSQSEIHRVWHRGDELFQSANFLVLSRDGQDPHPDDLPPHSEVAQGAIGSSSKIRAAAAARRPLGDLVSSRIARYIQRWHLYTGRAGNGRTDFQVRGPGLIWSVPSNPNNPWPEREARIRGLVEMAKRVNATQTGNSPDHIMVIGGDGGMLDAIAELGHLHLPFIGINGGTVGYLLNDGTPDELEFRLRRGEYTLLREALLHIAFTRPDGTTGVVHGFNEGFLRADGDGAGWMHVELDDNVLFENLMGDGLMLATSAGSTGWSYQKGGQRLWVGAGKMVLTGDATSFDRTHWISSSLEDDSVVTIKVIDNRKRPMRLVVDGKNHGPVTQVTMRRSKTHAAELGFFPEIVRDRRLARIRGH